MSLFGEEASPSPRKSAGLFGDDDAAAPAAQPKTGSSMFGDTTSAAANGDDSSPWGFTPSKKSGAGRGSLVKSLLAGAEVPEEYVDAFDSLQSGGSVSGEAGRRMLREVGIGQGEQEKIWSLVCGNGRVQELGRNEFNVLLALIGLAQEGEEVSLDGVDERRHKLPVPSLPQPQRKQEEVVQAPATPKQQSQAGAQERQQQQNGHTRKTSFGAGFGESDPWASPDVHKGHKHLNGVGAGGPQRTTSTFTTTAADPADGTTPSGTYGNGSAGQGDTSSSWGNTSSGYGPGGAEGEGFGAAGAGGDEGFGGGAGTVRTRPPQPRITTSKGAEEVVTVNLLEEKEGMFMFQHRNYEVASVRRNSKVIRRYSDFVWLLDCLHKRYPFRQLPLLPPKRMAINGNHIAADQSFVEKRRRGLARFANALVRHPVLREEQLVVMFLTVPTVDACTPPTSGMTVMAD